MREVLRVQLSLEGHEVQVAADGEGPVSRLRQPRQRDVVLARVASACRISMDTEWPVRFAPERMERLRC